MASISMVRRPSVLHYLRAEQPSVWWTVGPKDLRVLRRRGNGAPRASSQIFCRQQKQRPRVRTCLPVVEISDASSARPAVRPTEFSQHRLRFPTLRLWRQILLQTTFGRESSHFRSWVKDPGQRILDSLSLWFCGLFCLNRW